MSLDQARDILSWPRAELDPQRLSLQVRVIRIVVKIAGKALLDGSLDRDVARERERDAALARMVSELPVVITRGLALDLDVEWTVFRCPGQGKSLYQNGSRVPQAWRDDGDPWCDGREGEGGGSANRRRGHT
jgi:hypothetical protein